MPTTPKSHKDDKQYMQAPLLSVLPTISIQVQSKCRGSMCTRYMISRSTAELYGQQLDLGTVHLHHPTFASIVLSAQPVTGTPGGAVPARQTHWHPMTPNQQTTAKPLKQRGMTDVIQPTCAHHSCCTTTAQWDRSMLRSNT